MYVYIVQDKNNKILMVYSRFEDAEEYRNKYSGVNNPKSSEALYSIVEFFVIDGPR
jgi:hypothetical protein